MREKGMNAEEIVTVLMREKLEASIYITVDTLKYLKKGGRVTPAAAALGTVLNLKPVLTIQGEKLDAFAKVRGLEGCEENDAGRHGKGSEGTFCRKRSAIWRLPIPVRMKKWQSGEKEVAERFPGYEIHTDRLSLSVACHIGPGAMAVACSKKIEI